MTDEIPADLIQLKRKFHPTGRELAELSAVTPTPTAVITGEANENAADRERWTTLQRRQGDTAMQIHRYPALSGVAPAERFKLDEAASRAARQEG